MARSAPVECHVNLVPRAFPLKVGGAGKVVFPAPPTFKGKALGTRLMPCKSIQNPQTRFNNWVKRVRGKLKVWLSGGVITTHPLLPLLYSCPPSQAAWAMFPAWPWRDPPRVQTRCLSLARAHFCQIARKNYILFKISHSSLFFKYCSNFTNFSLDSRIKYILIKKKCMWEH